jgi:hypothetical protein
MSDERTEVVPEERVCYDAIETESGRFDVVETARVSRRRTWVSCGIASWW